MHSLTRDAVVAAMRRMRRLQAPNATISCDSVSALAFRDVFDLYMGTTGAPNAVWVDPNGGRAPAGSPLVAGLRLLRDPVLLPWLIARHLPALRQVQNAERPVAAAAPVSPILFLRSDHWFNLTSGGSVGHLKGVIDNLRALGRETHVVSTDRLQGIATDDHFHLCTPVYGGGRNLRQIPELEYNRQLIAYANQHWPQWRPRAIYQRLSLMNYAGAWLKARHGVPYICEYNGSFPWMARHWDKAPLFLERLATRIETLTLRAADLVVVVSDAVGADAESRGVSANRILVNPNGVEPEVFRPDVDGGSVRTALGLDNATVIGFIGTFGPWHGAEVLAEAFVALCQRRPELRMSVKLLMVGEGERRARTEAIVREAGLSACVVFTGRVPQAEAPRYLAACDIFASPHVPNPTDTPFFGSPTKLFEYMAMGRGIVASDLDQIGQVLAHDRTAWLVRPGSVNDLASGLERLIDDKSLRDRLGAAARDEAVRRYTWRAHVARILDALERNGR